VAFGTLRFLDYARNDVTLISAAGLGEDDAAGGGLKDAGDGHLLDGIDKATPAFNDYHGAVVQECDALAGLFSFLNDVDAQLLAGEDHGFEGVGEFIDVEDAYALELGDTVQVEICGEDVGFELFGEVYKLGIHLSAINVFGLEDLDGKLALATETGEDFQAAAASGAAERVVGVGDVAKLIEDKSRDDESAADEAGLGDIGDAAVDDGAGVDEDPSVGPAGKRRSPGFSTGGGGEASKLTLALEAQGKAYGAEDAAEREGEDPAKPAIDLEEGNRGQSGDGEAGDEANSA